MWPGMNIRWLEKGYAVMNVDRRRGKRKDVSYPIVSGEEKAELRVCRLGGGVGCVGR